MQKPTDCPLSTESRYDYDICERVVRQLQESHLHVFSVHVASSLPEELKTGSPNDEHTVLVITLTMLTDGRRGFLILVHEEHEFDAPLEMTELLCGLAPGAEPDVTFVVRGADMNTDDPCERPGTLPLTEPKRVRVEVERAYEEAFVEGPPIDHAVFLAAFAPFGFEVRDERATREMLADLGGFG
jgi:hypothetical protein